MLSFGYDFDYSMSRDEANEIMTAGVRKCIDIASSLYTNDSLS